MIPRECWALMVSTNGYDAHLSKAITTTWRTLLRIFVWDEEQTPDKWRFSFYAFLIYQVFSIIRACSRAKYMLINTIFVHTWS